MKYTDVIWDFNGTILDDVEAGILSVNEMLTKRGLPSIKDKDAYREIFRFPIIEYYRSLGFDFCKEPYEILAPIWVELYLKNSKSAPIRDGFLEAHEEFKKKGISQHVLSATELKMLKEQITALGIDGMFDSVYGLDNIHAYSKTDLAKGWREEHPRAKVLVIGDTEHDHTTAEQIGADCILVCGGHQTLSRLQKCTGAIVVSSFSELLGIIKKI